jgi:hypothetical protein
MSSQLSFTIYFTVWKASVKSWVLLNREPPYVQKKTRQRYLLRAEPSWDTLSAIVLQENREHIKTSSKFTSM